MNYIFRPLIWTGPRTPLSARRSKWTFKAPWSDTLLKLDRELNHLKATEIVIEAGFQEKDLRLDGMPRANAPAPEFPGIKVSFNTRQDGRLEYATDVCDYWQHNVRSIALGLEALRAVDRHGITRGRQQYTGFKAIESGSGTIVSKEMARHALRAMTGLNPAVNDEQLYRAAVKVAHPDKGGSREAWDIVQMAKEALGV